MPTLRIVFFAPGFNLPPRMREFHKPVRVEALVPQPAVEAFHMPVLHRPAGLDVNQFDLPLRAPADEVAAW